MINELYQLSAVLEQENITPYKWYDRYKQIPKKDAVRIWLSADGSVADIDTIKKVFDTKRALERKIKRVDPVLIWPMIKKNENSQTISIITNLNLPNKTASWQGERLSRANYSVSDIELKDKNDASCN